MPHVGEDKFFWASDYPHPDHPGELSGGAARDGGADDGVRAPGASWGENVARAYKLG